MKYFQEMDTKWGFEDGNCIPPDAEKCREVYIKVLNKLLEKKGSDCRIIEFDRPGVHNWCQWMRVWKDNIGSHQEHPADDAWYKSVNEAYEMGLDEFVETKCFIREDELEAALTARMNSSPVFCIVKVVDDLLAAAELALKCADDHVADHFGYGEFADELRAAVSKAKGSVYDDLLAAAELALKCADDHVADHFGYGEFADELRAAVSKAKGLV